MLTASLPAVPVISVAVCIVSMVYGTGNNRELTVFLPGSHHAAAEQLRNAAIVELDNAQGIIPVIVLAQFRRDRRDTNRRDGLDHRVLAKEPQGQIDIMDGAVDKDPTRELRVFHEEPAGIQLVAGLRAEYTRTTNLAALHLLKRITIRGIESTAEAADDFLRRTASLGGAVGVDNGLALYKIQLDTGRKMNLTKRIRTSSTLVLNGFSHSTCNPLLMALIACSACTLVAEATTTACNEGSERSISS